MQKKLQFNFTLIKINKLQSLIINEKVIFFYRN